MEKIDLFKQFSIEYKAGLEPALIETGPAQYLAIDGQGEPGGAAFEECIGALYSMAYTIKMTRKSAGCGDYAVCKMESLWFGPDGSDNMCNVPKKDWRWTLMIRTPECVGKTDIERAIEALLKKGKCEAMKRVRLETLNEGRCVQMLHVGPYEKVGDTIEKMLALAESKKLAFAGKHHEIYLSDPRRVEPERLKTIVRRPVR